MQPYPKPEEGASLDGVGSKSKPGRMGGWNFVIQWIRYGIMLVCVSKLSIKL